MELDQAFESKDDIARSVLESLQQVMKDYGYSIVNTLVTDLAPDSKVKASMNEINAARRLKEAASHQAEADKVRQVKAAEADAEARYLSGLGVARQRKAIVKGLQASVSEFSSEVKGADPKDVSKFAQKCIYRFAFSNPHPTSLDEVDILLLSQYFDTLSTVGANSLILEHDPATVASLQQQVGISFMANRQDLLS